MTFDNLKNFNGKQYSEYLSEAHKLFNFNIILTHTYLFFQGFGFAVLPPRFCISDESKFYQTPKTPATFFVALRH